MFIVFCFSGLAAFGLAILTIRYRQSTSRSEALCIVLVVTLSGTFFGVLSYLLISDTYARLSYPDFQATIVDYESETDEDNLLMHRAILRFTDMNGDMITRPSQHSSSIRPTIGSTPQIYYQDGHLYEPSFIGLIIFLIFIPLTGMIVFFALRFVISASRSTVNF
ncbi:hypothetical protein [Yoonia sp. 2307UL14-13]|uniref:hypothetical protein n=1 Tax=Yoonia sp. 2307UL14-13 TaxID=3126506 RepID=UPI0030B1F88F